MNYLELREKYPEFVYERFDYKIQGNDLITTFLFRVGTDIEFKPCVKFTDIPFNKFSTNKKENLDTFVFNMGLSEIASYWKATCSPKIIVKAGYLETYQIGWWEDLILNGMGQFFYENKIDFTKEDFIKITSTSSKKFIKAKTDTASGILIPVGGGKDSAVTLQLLKNEKNVAAFIVNPTEAANDLVKVSGIKKVIKVERTLDTSLIDLNSRGFLNGHTPFSSVIAFLSIFAAHLYGYGNVALSNERSSDEENTEYLGKKINHQYSKTLEFENKLREYVKMYIAEINYFSFLRPLYELQIAGLFSKMPQYFKVFRSCNIGQKTNSWCNNCSKCLSTYILLKPFLDPTELYSIFGEDLLQKEILKPILSELVDEVKVKPFECVGTREELKNALKNDLSLLTSWNFNNNLPQKYERLLRDKIQQ